MFRVNITLLLPCLCTVNPSILLTFFGHDITMGAQADLLILPLPNPLLNPFLLGDTAPCSGDLAFIPDSWKCVWAVSCLNTFHLGESSLSRSQDRCIAAVLASLFTILQKSHTLISRGVIFTSKSQIQIFNLSRPNTASSAILIKTCPLEALPVINALRDVSLPVAKLFVLFYDTVQCWRD